MKLFLSKMLRFCIPIGVCLLLLFTVGKKYAAAYRITNSYSFNEKVKYLPPPSEKQILTIGSSMSLNNLDSPLITKYFKTTNYLNTSVWGLSIMDVRGLISVFQEMYHPKTVICVSNVMDFATPQIQYDIVELSSFMKTKEVKSYQWFNYCAYFLKQSFKNLLNFNTNRVYTSLVFDQWGGVPLAEKNFMTKQVRWDEELHFDTINLQAYDALADISSYLKKKNVHFVFIQPPVRQKIMDSVYYAAMAKHTNRVREIIESNGHTFADKSEAKYADSLFVDSAHLNSLGAKRLTQEIFQENTTSTGSTSISLK